MKAVLLAFAAACFTARAVEFPSDSGYAVREKYGAKGDGKTDDTTAFAQAAKDHVRRLYIPRGVYLLSDTVHFSPKRWILQGEDEKATLLRLADGSAGFDDVTMPKPFISTFSGFMNPKAAMGQAFRSSVCNLTIEVGARNPGAVRDVTLRSLDPQRAGRAGRDLKTAARRLASGGCGVRTTCPRCEIAAARDSWRCWTANSPPAAKPPW